MPNLIEEIQRDASNDSIPASQLLRRMKIAASKLRLTELGEWVEHELQGYPDEENLPAYRVLGGVPMAFNRFRGWGMMQLGPDESMNISFSVILYTSSISEVEAHAGSSGPLYLSYPEFLERACVQSQPGLDKIALSVDQGKFRTILSAVRNRALDWALAVEEAGVAGVGFSFTAEERIAAQNVTNNIYGNNARINQNSNDSSVNRSVTRTPKPRYP